MEKALKNYWAFTNPVYRLVIWVLVPGIFLLVNSVVCTLEIVEEVDIVCLGSLVLFYIFEAVADYWFMGGFYAKNNSSLEFMQSSHRFFGFMQSVAVVDAIRRVLWYIGVSTLVLWIGLENGYSMDVYRMFGYVPLLEALLAQTAILIGRHFVVWNHAYLCVLIGFFLILLSMHSMSLVYLYHPILVNGILAVLFVLIGIVTVWYTGKKVRESYYDEGL